MNNLIGIIAGDPESINSEIIAKAWKKRKSFKKLNILIIGNYDLIKKQLKKIKINVELQKIDNFNKVSFKKKLNIYDIPLKFKKPFRFSAKNKYTYIINSLNCGIELANKKKIMGLINCPINKKEIFGEKPFGITEYMAKKNKRLGDEVMLIYNKKLSVSPITTHIKLKKVPKNISSLKIIKKIITINKFFKKRFKFKPKFGVLGLNPHNDEFRNDSEEKKIIIPAIKRLKSKNIFLDGPISTDTAFLDFKKKKINVIIGMYHDQVLSPFKTIFRFDAVNITLGIPFLRISPDHGTGREIIGKNIANPNSLIECIKFFKN